MRVTPGPLGHKRGLLGRKSSQTNTPTQRLQDIQILPILETVMQDTTQNAIIFSNVEDWGISTTAASYLDA